MEKTIELSIIIVNYNTRDLLIRCLSSLSHELPSVLTEIIVVDNASSDGSTKEVRQRFPEIKTIKNKSNLGFAAANNIGIKESLGTYILLLNSDTELGPGVLEYMMQCMNKHPDAGVATCKLVLPDGSLDQASHRGFPTPWAAFTYFVGLERLFPTSHVFGQYHLGFNDMTKIHDIDSPSGAFFFMRRSIVREVGLLDESYFMYGEDLDFAYRIKKAGWKILYCPDRSVLHMKKQSGRSHSDKNLQKQMTMHFYTTMGQFYDKHYEKRYGALLSGIIKVALWIRVRLTTIW